MAGQHWHSLASFYVDPLALKETTMSLTDIQRRTLANLSIPRNADDLAAHLRPYVLKSAKDVDHMLRNGLSSNGWVKKVPHIDDPAKLASAVQKSKTLMELPDDKADIYSRRMLRPDLAWRMSGDLWMLTEEGLAELHKPTVDTSPMVPAQVQALIDDHWARTLKGHDMKSYGAKWGGGDKPDGPSLAQSFLEDEFLAWCKAVSDECERVWNVRPVAPLAGGASGFTDTYENMLLDAENQKTALGAVVDPWFMALSILAFTDADTGTTADNGTHIPTYTGYARKSVAGTDMPAASGTGGSTANTSAITFAACTAGTSTILAFGNCSASTVGTLRKWGDCASTVISTTQTPPTFAIGAYVTTVA